jgi:hypothetical protein
VNFEDAVSSPHVHDDDLQLYIHGRLDAVQVDVFERHVFSCPECKSRLETAARFVAQLVGLQGDHRSSDKRSEQRFRTSDTGFLRSFAPLLTERWPVQIVDVSKSGLGLLVSVHLAPGVLVQVQIGKTFVLGEVIYSKKAGEHRFRIGIRLQDILSRKK